MSGAAVDWREVGSALVGTRVAGTPDDGGPSKERDASAESLLDVARIIHRELPNVSPNTARKVARVLAAHGLLA